MTCLSFTVGADTGSIFSQQTAVNRGISMLKKTANKPKFGFMTYLLRLFLGSKQPSYRISLGECCKRPAVLVEAWADYFAD